MTTHMSPKIGSATGAALKTGAYGTTELAKVRPDLRDALIADVAKRSGAPAAEVRDALLAKWQEALVGGQNAAADPRVAVGVATGAPAAQPLNGPDGTGRGGVGARLSATMFDRARGVHSPELKAVLARFDNGAGLFNRKADGKLGDAEVRAGQGYSSLAHAALGLDGESRASLSNALSRAARGNFHAALADQAWTAAGASPAALAKLRAGQSLEGPEARQALSTVATGLANGSVTAAHVESMGPALVSLAQTVSSSGSLSAAAQKALAPLLGQEWLPQLPSPRPAATGALTFPGLTNKVRSVLEYHVAEVETWPAGTGGGGFVKVDFWYPSYEPFHGDKAFRHAAFDANTTSSSESVYFVSDLSQVSLPKAGPAASAQAASESFQKLIESLETTAVAGWHAYTTGFGRAGENMKAAVSLGTADVVMGNRNWDNTNAGQLIVNGDTAYPGPMGQIVRAVGVMAALRALGEI